MPATALLTLELLTPLGQRVASLSGMAGALMAELPRRSAALAAGPYLLRLQGPSFSRVQRVVKE